MTMLFADGFDFIDSSARDGANNLWGSGWDWHIFSTTYADIKFVRGVNGGRAAKLQARVFQDCSISKSISCGNNVVVGFLLAASGSTSQNMVNAVGVYGPSSGVYFDIAGTRVLTIRFEPAGTSYVFGSIGNDVFRYFEVEVIDGTAYVYLNNVLLTSAALGVTENMSTLKFLCEASSSSDSYVYLTVDDVYAVSMDGSGIATRPGPISIIQLKPTANGSVNELTPVPATANLFENVDDDGSTAWTTADTDYLHGAGEKEERFLCSAVTPFGGEALGYVVAASVKAAAPCANVVKATVDKGGSNLTGSSKGTSIALYGAAVSDIFYALPDASPMTQANLEATEFGIKLTRP